MLVKFEQIRMVQSTRNFELVDKKKTFFFWTKSLTKITVV